MYFLNKIKQWAVKCQFPDFEIESFGPLSLNI